MFADGVVCLFLYLWLVNIAIAILKTLETKYSSSNFPII